MKKNSLILIAGIIIFNSCENKTKQKFSKTENRDSAVFYFEMGNEIIKNAGKGLKIVNGIEIMYEQTEEARWQAIACFTKGIEFDSTYGSNYSFRASEYIELVETIKLKLYKQALNDYSKLIEMDSSEVSSYLDRGYFYLNQMKDTIKACQDFVKYYKVERAGNPNLYNLCKCNSERDIFIWPDSSLIDWTKKGNE